MSAALTIRLVAGREVRERGRSKAFWIGTCALLFGVIAVIVVPAKLGQHGQRTFQVGTVGAVPGGLASSVIADAAALSGRAHIRAIGSGTQARAALDAQTLDLVIDGQAGVLVRGENTDQSVTDLASLVARDLAVQARLQAAGLPAEQIPGLVSTVPAPVRTLIPVSPDNTARRAIVVLGTIILYLSLTAYGGWVTSGVLEEKSSRVVEVILSAVRPPELLAGKVIGIGLLGLGQFAAVALTGTIAAIWVGRHLPPSTPAAIGLIVLWFLLGYAFYCSAFAAAGAASSRQEEAPTVAGPLTLVILLGYFVSLGIQSNPDSGLARITPFIPPLAPMTMSARVLLGHAEPWELPASIAVMLVATYGLVRLAGSAYAGNILRFGGRVTLRGVLRP
jgi:ABC-2 type transport system permease protein